MYSSHKPGSFIDEQKETGEVNDQHEVTLLTKNVPADSGLLSSVNAHQLALLPFFLLSCPTFSALWPFVVPQLPQYVHV